MRCKTCNGTLYRNWDRELQCLACSRIANSPPRTATPLAIAKQRGRPPSVNAAEIVTIRETLAGVPWGQRGAIARRLAAQFGVSAVYVREIAHGHRRTG